MKKILAIDDQQDNLTTIKAVINNYLPDCKVLTALSGKKGLEIASKDQPDTILLDIIMPDMDGYEVCKKLKKDESTKHIPVVMITAIKTDFESRIKGLNLGADAFLSKPIDPVELSAQINVMLRIKEAEDKLRAEKKDLEVIVLERTIKLKESEEKYKALYNNAPLSYQSLNEEGNFIDVNPAWLRTLGYDRGVVIGKCFGDFLHPDWKANFRKNFLEFKRRGYVHDVHYKIRHKEGHYLDILSEGYIGYYPNGSFKQTYCVFQNITKRKLIEEEKERSQSLLKATLESTADGILVVAKDGTWSSFNQKFIDMWGIPASICESGDDQAALDYIFENLAFPEKFMAKVSELYNNPERESFDTIELKDRRIFDRYSQPQRLGKEIIGRVWSFRDITEYKDAEETIRASEEKFRDMANLLPQIVYETDIKGNLTFINKQAYNYFGYSQEDYEKGMNALQTLIPEDRDKAKENIQNIMCGKDVGTHEYTALRKDGSTFPVMIFSSAIIKDNKPAGLRGIIVDITERKKAETDLNNALKKATESDRLKSVFLATMSHELRTPLNAIIGFSGLFNKDLSIDEFINFGKTINKSGNHLLNIIEDMFDITTLETGKIKLEEEDFIMQNALKEVHEIIKNEQQITNKNNIELSIIIPQEEKDLIIRTDYSKLKQILINLLKNALKFTDTGKVQYGYDIETDQGKSVIKFYVKDTGIGIPEDKRELIFDVFRQADDSHTRLYGGVGIGLTVSKRLTELLGGKIWFESKVGKGTIFNFTVPYEKPAIAERITNSEKGGKELLVGKTVLVVEDVKSSFDLLEVILGNAGTKTIWAKDGEEAVKLCKKNSNIDLVLMDINMPVMNGFEATRVIKKIKPDLPIIAQTAYAVVGDRERSIEAGCDDYISKPIDPAKLLGKIIELLI